MYRYWAPRTTLDTIFASDHETCPLSVTDQDGDLPRGTFQRVAFTGAKKVASLNRSRLVSRASILHSPVSVWKFHPSNVAAPPPAAHFQRRPRSPAGPTKPNDKLSLNKQRTGIPHATFVFAAPFWLAVKNRTLPSQPSSLRAAPLRLGPCSCRPRPAVPCNSTCTAPLVAQTCCAKATPALVSLVALRCASVRPQEKHTLS